MSYHCGIISIVGRPNAGKSTLLNELVGQKIAAVTAKPQTTRQSIRGIHHSEQCQMIFMDTPGYHEVQKKEALNHWMVEQAKVAIADADISILLIPADKKWQPLDQKILQLIQQSGAPYVIALSKIDLVSKGRLLPLIETISKAAPDIPIIPLSALKQDGLKTLLTTLESRLPEGEPLYPSEIPTDQNMRQLAAEIVREKLFASSREEVPYSLAVQIETYEEPDSEGGVTRIGAVILVERQSQKMIIIGKGGQFLKQVGTEARKELEEIIGGKVFLSLFVKVSKDWTVNPKKLRELGYA